MALLFALLATAAGLYLSGYIVLMLLKLPQASLAWDTWPGYVRVLTMPQFAPFAGKIKAAGAIGFGFPGLLWLGLLYLLFRAPAKALHGDARAVRVQLGLAHRRRRQGARDAGSACDV